MRILLVTALAAAASGGGPEETADRHRATVANCAARPAGFHNRTMIAASGRWAFT